MSEVSYSVGILQGGFDMKTVCDFSSCPPVTFHSVCLLFSWSMCTDDRLGDEVATQSSKNPPESPRPSCD